MCLIRWTCIRWSGLRSVDARGRRANAPATLVKPLLPAGLLFRLDASRAAWMQTHPPRPQPAFSSRRFFTSTPRSPAIDKSKLVDQAS